MNIAILANHDNSYFIKKFMNEISVFDSMAEVKVLHPSNFNLYLDNKSSKIYYKNEILSGVDILIPRIKPYCSSFELSIIDHFKKSGMKVVNSAKTLSNCKNRFQVLQRLKGIDGIKIPKSIIVNNNMSLKRGIEMLGNMPVVLKTSIPYNKGLDSIYIDNIKQSETFLDISFLFNKLIVPEQNIIIQEFIKKTEAKTYQAIVLNGKVIKCIAVQEYLMGNNNFDILDNKSAEHIDFNSIDIEKILSIAKEFQLDFGIITFLKAQEDYFFIDVNPIPDLEKIESEYNIDVIIVLIRNLYF